MSLRQFPIIPAIVVLVAAGIMVALGVWQLGRAEEKAELIAEYSAISPESPAVEISSASPADWNETLRFRRVVLDCSRFRHIRSAAGTSASGAKGWALIAQCTPDGLGEVEAKIGWSRDPNPPAWSGGQVAGVLDQNGRVIADPPLAGLEQIAKPDPSDLPNNHLAYAGQWFFFAFTALIIFWFAIKKRLSERREEEG